jgi:hypothetical protein
LNRGKVKLEKEIRQESRGNAEVEKLKRWEVMSSKSCFSLSFSVSQLLSF